MTISGGSALPKDEIDRMMREAEQHAEEDRTRREEAEVRNQAESLVYQTEKFVKENDEKLPTDVKDGVNAALGEAQEALKGTDSAAIQAALPAAADAGRCADGGRGRGPGWPEPGRRRRGRRDRRRGEGPEVTTDALLPPKVAS